MLTKKQAELLRFIHEHVTRDGVAPSFEEMKAAVGLRSKSGIHRLISALEERGFIRRLPHRARALEVCRLPEPLAAELTSGHMAVSDSVTRKLPEPANHNTVEPAGLYPAGETLTVPMMGRIAAGTPIEAIRNPDAAVDVPASWLRSGNNTYALEVAGDSMVDAGIHDGDTVLIEPAQTAENGAIIVALIDDMEVTLKRLRRHGSMIALEPANAAYETRVLPANRVTVQGRLIGLMRRY